MKPRTFITPALLGCFFISGLHGQNLEPVRTAPIDTQAAIPETTIEPGQLSAESETRVTDLVSGDIITVVRQKPQPINFDVIQSRSERVHVEESPEMVGVPAPKGMINLTVELVRQPQLSDPPPLPPLEPNDPAVVARTEELARKYPETQLVFVSASVYKSSITQFRLHAGGKRAKEIRGWSNIDFNHFSGFANYQVHGTDDVVRSYGLIMGIGNVDAPDDSAAIPKLPNLATQGPAFILTGGDIKDRETKELIEGMHALYKTEGQRLAEAYRERTKAYEDRKAFLLANPPRPKDVTIRFWNRDGSNPR